MTLPVTVSSVDEGVNKVLSAVERAISGESLLVWIQTEAFEHISRRAKERFESEGDKVSGAWAPLAESTVKIREREGFPGEHPILHRTGALEDYIVHSQPVIGEFPGGVFMDAPGPTSDGELQAKLKQAQLGSGKKVPKRPVIGMNIEDAASLTEMLSLTLHEKIVRGVL